MTFKTQYRVVYKRKNKTGSRTVTTLWNAHQKARFLLHEADPHYACDHDSGGYNCLEPIDWVRIDERQVGEWTKGDPDPAEK